MRELLSSFAEVVSFDGVVATLRSGDGRLDAVVVNWTDNDLLDRRSRKVAARKIVKLFARTLAMRLAARRLVFVRHNNYPHAVAPGHEARASRWVSRYERLFDAVITHSGDASQRPRLYCPHPLYHRMATLPDATSLDPLPARYYVVFGRVVRYKRLEALIDAFPADRTLLIVGAVGDRDYAAELAARPRANVLFRPGLLPEAEAQAIVSRSAALLISHADDDVVVSSSFFFAMTLQVPVIAIETPFLAWVAPRVGPRLLRLASDVDGLCRALDDETASSGDATAAALIEREFGDAVALAALRRAMGLDRPPRQSGPTSTGTPHSDENTATTAAVGDVDRKRGVRSVRIVPSSPHRAMRRASSDATARDESTMAIPGPAISRSEGTRNG